MKKIVSFILLALICISGYAQTIDPNLLEEMGRRRDNEMIPVFVVMRQQYDPQQLNLRDSQFATRAERRDFVVNELKQFTEASQYDLRHSLNEMQRNGLVTEPNVLWIANAISFEATKGAILSLADRSDILAIGFDEEINWIPDGEESYPADPTREIAWNVSKVNADQVWNLGYTGQGVVVAVLDTGVNYNHLDLADHLWDGGPEFPHHGYDVRNNDNDPMDDQGHGTHCAGIVCGDGTSGSQTGIAPDATLMIVKCTKKSTNGTRSDGYDYNSTFSSIIASAMQWALDHGCDVISLSLGIGVDCYWGGMVELYRNACVNVLNAGVIAAIAAGNNGEYLIDLPIPRNIELPGACPPPYLDPYQQLNPGGLSCSVCVGAVNSNDKAASFTSHGPVTWWNTDYGDYPYTPDHPSKFGLIRPDVCAPGVGIKSLNYETNTGYMTKSGTSMAAPCVAGCMALLLSKNPDATPADLCRVLEETAVPLSTNKSNLYGCGRVDALAAIHAIGYDFSAVCSTEQTLYYNIIDAANHYVEITCPGTSFVYGWNGFVKPTGNITLPSTVPHDGVTYTVKAIGDYAFYGCYGLTGSLTIPNSVTRIGARAFLNCSGFSGSLTLPNSVTSIDIGAFHGCDGLTGSLTIPNSVATIQDRAFQGCSGLTGLIFGSSVTDIGTQAFRSCTSVTSITVLPGTPPSLGRFAFKNVPTDTPVFVPCESLEDYQAASGWSDFTNIQCFEDPLTYSINPDGVSVTVTGHVDGTAATGELSIPSTKTINGVTYTVTAIGNNAFENCTGLTGSLNIPNSVTTVGNRAFYNCWGLHGSLTIPNSVTTIGENAFYYCLNMEGQLTIGNSLTTIGAHAFDYCCSLSGSLTIPNSVTTIGNYAFSNCWGFDALTLSNFLTTIGNSVFAHCDGFTGSLTIPNSVTSIGTNAFFGCSGFTGTLTIPNSVTTIQNKAFQGCSGLTGLTLGSSVATIGEQAFYNCSGFASLTALPVTPPTLGTNAFYNVTATIPVYVLCESLDAYQNATGWSAFTNIQCIEILTYSINPDGVSVTVTGHVHGTAATGELYIPTTKTINGVTYTVTAIGDNAFKNCSGLTGNLIIPNSVTTIGEQAFQGCSGFTGSLTLPNSVTTIGESAFYYCNGFTGSLTIPNSVTTIDDDAIAHCSGFNGSLTIGNSVTSIGYGAFYDCSGFTGSLTIPNSVTTIGEYAFCICSGFTGTLTIGSSVTTIGRYAFEGCSSFTSMTVLPDTPPTLYTNVFYNVPTDIPVYVPCASLEDYQAAEGWNAFTNMQCDPLTYSINDDEVSVTVTGHIDGTAATGELIIPETKTIDGVTYPVTEIRYSAFQGCSGLTGSLVIPNSVTTIGMDAFTMCTGFDGTLTLGNSVTSIGEFAFYGCSGFTGSLTIPNSVTAIERYAFRGCSGFDGPLTLGSSVTIIGERAFNDCSGFTGALVIPNTLTTLENHVFDGCSGLTSLTLPASVTSIGSSVFSDCTGLTRMMVFRATPPSLGTNAFRNVPTDIPVCVPCESLEDYQAASGWSAFTNMQDTCDGPLIYAINDDGESVTVIGHIDGTAATGTLTIPETKTIDGVTYAVTAIGESAFEMCTQLTGSLTIPNSVTTIGNSAFRICFGFNGSLTLGSSVTNIGSYAFEGCSDFASMTVLPETPPTLGTDVFSNVPSGIPVYVPCSALEDYQAASGWSVFSNMQCIETLTVYDGTATNFQIPAYITYFDDFTRSQYVIPASALSDMIGATLYSMTFYTGATNVPYTTVSDADVYLKEVGYTSISAYEPKESATTVYSGRFSIVSADDGGGMMTIHFSTPYTYRGGNLLVGVENTEDNGFKYIVFYGQTVSGASISGRHSNSTGTIPATQQNFIPETTFNYVKGPKPLPYTYGFEEAGEFECWTMLDCHANTEITTDAHYEGSHCFQFWYTTNPPQYLISPKLESTTEVGVSFRYRNEGSEWPETFQVGYSTTTKSPDAFTWGEELTAQNSTWTLYENTFPVGTKYVAIKHLSYDQNLLYLDDFHFIRFLCPLEDQCELTFELYDDYGDGWNGAAIKVVDVETDVVLATLTNENLNGVIGYGTDELNTHTLVVCDGRALRFEWINGSWDDECSYTVTDANGNVVFFGTGAMSEPFTHMVKCLPELTVYDGTATNNRIPAYIYYFDDFTRSQFVIPAEDLVEMIGRPIRSMTFYTIASNVPYTTVSNADVYLKEVDYTSISAYEPKESATTVYSGLFSILSADGGGMMTINFTTPYTYQGGNLLVGIENTEDNGYMNMYFVGQSVNGASISGSHNSSAFTIPATQQNFIPTTTFAYLPSMCAPQTLPYTYGFEEEDEFDCWTMLNCDENTGRIRYSSAAFNGNYVFRFFYNTNPPQYLISPDLECTTDVDVSFYYRNESGYLPWPETFQVGYSTTIKSPDAFIWGDVLTAENSTWTQYENTFPAGTRYVAIKHLSYDQNVLYVDDFSFQPVFCSPEDQCELTFELTDSYGDGWNGAAIRVVDVETDIVLASMANENLDGAYDEETQILTLAVCDGRELRFEWYPGGWDGECSYTVTDVNGIEIFSGTGAMSEPFNYIVDCPKQYIFLTNGNWNDGSCWSTSTVPPAGSDVIIQANVTVPAGYLAVANAVSLDGGSITVADGGQLKHNTQGLEVTMKKNIVGYDDANDIRNYYLLSFPFVHIDVPAAMSATGSDFYRFDLNEPNAEWRNLRSEPFNIEIVHGYLFASPESNELSLSGNTYSTTTETMWDHVVEYDESSANLNKGWELLGNPLTYNVYIYRQTSDSELVPMPIMMYDANGDLQTVYGGPVAPMQGFFVHVTEETTVCFRGMAHLNDYVDLGLPSGLLWATCNVGANAPEDYGDYFAWGETTPKDTYTEENYTYSENPTILPSNHDAATANWGSGWRMPTKAEWQELYNNTTVTWTTQNGVSGRLFTASNGNSLFLPATGRRWGGEFDGVSIYGFYWSSSLFTGYSVYAWLLGFDSGNYDMYGNDRGYGQSVRPVRSASQN